MSEPMPEIGAEIDDPEVIGKLCADCLPAVSASRWQTSDAGGVIVVNVAHARSCPDFAAAVEVGTAPDGVMVRHFEATRLIVRHEFESGDEESEADVGR